MTLRDTIGRKLAEFADDDFSAGRSYWLSCADKIIGAVRTHDVLAAANIPPASCDSDGTATAALNEDLAVPKDCQARAARYRPTLKGSKQSQEHP